LFIFNIYSTNKSQQNSKIKSSLDNIYLKKTIKEITKNLEPRYTTINYKSKPGDTYQGIINKLDITQNEKNLLLKTIQNENALKILKINQKFYGFQIDFQRDIWKNDSFQIIYEEFLNEDNKVIDTGEIIFANLSLQNTDLQLYKYEYEKNKIDYFDESGKSIKKTLMKTPINGARLSSSYGKRKHPILGYTKMHTGTDFAAPMGTPIMASGDGKVIKAGWCGGGGNCVKIKHNSTYQTVYAHMSKFGRGIKRGVRVKQGQIIGYVGSTGLSTGPHLHYEVIENGRKINSQKLKLPSGKVLKGEDRKKFEVTKIKIDVLKSNLIANLN
jgi:murein DD-endopeptidase MepM/ murein hydrolase activator NlpD